LRRSVGLPPLLNATPAGALEKMSLSSSVPWPFSCTKTPPFSPSWMRLRRSVGLLPTIDIIDRQDQIIPIYMLSRSRKRSSSLRQGCEGQLAVHSRGDRRSDEVDVTDESYRLLTHREDTRRSLLLLQLSLSSGYGRINPSFFQEAVQFCPCCTGPVDKGRILTLDLIVPRNVAPTTINC